MSETVENLVIDLLVWLQRQERTYKETMEAWRTSCPRLPVWEEANERGLVETSSHNGRLLVRVSRDGLAFLAKRRLSVANHFFEKAFCWALKRSTVVSYRKVSGGGSMPVYDYICKDCQHSFELVLTLSEHDKENIRCPKCEGKNVEQDAAAFYAVTSKKS